MPDWEGEVRGRLAGSRLRPAREAEIVGEVCRASGALERLLAGLRAAGLESTLHEGVPPEPDLAAVQRCMDAAVDADSVIGIGGGSVLDVAKGAAALAGTGASAAEYFAGKPVPEHGKPLLALPTTAGTGSEVTWACILVDRAMRRKASIRGPGMMPAVALNDPELTVSLPPPVAGPSGMNAVAHCVEAFYAEGATPLLSLAAEEGIRALAASLPALVEVLRR